MANPRQANRIPRAGAPVGQSRDVAGQPPDDFRVSLCAEIGASLDRALRLHKAETIAAALDRKRSTVYRWAGHPEEVPAAALPVLAHFDPDPDFLPRIGGHLLAQVSAAAMARKAAGGVRLIVEEVGPGRWTRR